MPFLVMDHNLNRNSRIYRILDSETSFYFDVYFIQGPFSESHVLTTFVDPVGYDELNPDGFRKNLPPTFYQALSGRNEQEWESLAVQLVEAYLEYRREGTHLWMIRPMDPVVEGPVSEPETPVERLSRYERPPVI